MGVELAQTGRFGAKIFFRVPACAPGAGDPGRARIALAPRPRPLGQRHVKNEKTRFAPLRRANRGIPLNKGLGDLACQPVGTAGALIPGLYSPGSIPPKLGHYSVHLQDWGSWRLVLRKS